MTADFGKDDIGRIGESWRFGLQRCRIKETRGHTKMIRDSVDCRLIRLQIDGCDAGKRTGRNIVFRQQALRQIDGFARLRAAFATHAKHQCFRMIDQIIRPAFRRIFGHLQRDRPVVINREVPVFEP